MKEHSTLDDCWIMAGLFMAFAGCAHHRTPEPRYMEAASQLHSAACFADVVAPATLPLEDLGGPRPLAFYLQIALERNPRILAAQRRVAATAETIPQQTALANPMLQDTF